MVTGSSSYGGSCACAAVRFAAEVDLAGATGCPCPRCRKTGGRSALAAAFRLIAGEDALEPASAACGVRMRCARCGVEPFSFLEDDGVMVNVWCLDEVEPTV